MRDCMGWDFTKMEGGREDEFMRLCEGWRIVVDIVEMEKGTVRKV